MAIKRTIENVGVALEAIWFSAYFLAALALVVVGPLIWLYRLVSAGHLLAAVAVGICWALSLAVVIRETRRRGITVISFAIFVTWLVLLIYVFRDSIT